MDLINWVHENCRFAASQNRVKLFKPGEDSMGLVYHMPKETPQTDNNIQAIKWALISTDDYRVVYQNPNGFITAAMAYEIRDNEIEVIILGSVEKGIGRALMKHVARQALQKDRSLMLVSLPESAGFYKKIGLEPGGGRNRYKADPQKRLPQILRTPDMLAYNHSRKITTSRKPH